VVAELFRTVGSYGTRNVVGIRIIGSDRQIVLYYDSEDDSVLVLVFGGEPLFT
jgi:hypothetical protein